MKRSMYIWFSLFIILFSCHKPVSEIDGETLDTYLDLVGRNYQDMGELVIRKDGKTLYHKSFTPEGLITPQNQKMKYRIGSISKLFVAIITFQMQEEGVLSLDETIDSFFPDVPNAEKITISHLLSHTSGLKDIVVKNDSITDWLFQPVSDPEIRDEIIRQGILFEPGENTSYSNSGYYILTRILEKKSGKRFPELLNEKILQPLKLTHTVAGAEDGPDIASPYKYNYKNRQWEDTPDFYFPNIQGVGDVASNPADMGEIIDALFAGKLISETSLEEMKPVSSAYFGKGLATMPFNDKVFYGHSGGTFGAYAILMHNEKDNLTIALTLNGQEMILNDLLIGILTIVYGLEFEMPVFITDLEDFDPEHYVLLEGVYGNDDFPLKLSVFRQEDDLYMQGTGQIAFALNQIEENKFIRKDYGLEAEFLPEEGKLNFTQFGRNWMLIRE